MKKSIYTSFLLLLITVSGANAQYAWKNAISREEGARYIDIYASCNYKNSIYLVGKIFDTNTKVSTVHFFRTNDGGKSWDVQDSKVHAYEDKWMRDYRIQQIDSLNVVALADSGIILRSFDNGESWSVQNIEVGYSPNSVHFHDPLQGIITVKGFEDIVFLTSNGGSSWSKVRTLVDRGLSDCYSYGGDKYRVFSPTDINLFVTDDKWGSYQSSTRVISPSEDSTFDKYRFEHIKFTEGETVFAFGKYTKTSDGVIARSLDGGNTWEKPVSLFDLPSSLRHMSNPNRDTIYASGLVTTTHDLLIRSTDKGKTWVVDTLSSDVMNVEVYGVEVDDYGRMVIVSELGVFYGEDTTKLSVEKDNKIRYYSHIYPNPVNERVTIESFLGGKEVHLIDLLGRKVMSGITEADGKIIFNVSTLSYGIYGVLLRRDEGLVTIGKIAVIGGAY